MSKTTKTEIRKHLKEVKTVVRAIETELADGDGERLENLAHQLLGISDLAANETIDYCLENL